VTLHLKILEKEHFTEANKWENVVRWHKNTDSILCYNKKVYILLVSDVYTKILQ